MTTDEHGEPSGVVDANATSTEPDTTPEGTFNLGHEPDQVAREAAAADYAAAEAGYSGEALEVMRMVTAADDEITDEQREVRDKTAKGMMLVGIRTVVIRALGMLGTIVLARLLSPTDYGVVALGLTIMIIGRFFADGGLGPGLIRREEPPTTEEFAALVSFQRVITIPIFIVGSILAFTVFPVGGTVGAITISMMLAGLVIDVARTPNAIMCERELDYKTIVRAEIAEFTVYNVLAVGLVVFGGGLIGVGVANILRALTGSGLLIITGPVHWIRGKWNWGLMRPVAAFGAYFQLSWMITLLQNQGLAVLVLAISGSAALGAFDQARRLLVIVTLVFESAWRVGLPGLARMMEAGTAPKLLFNRGLGIAGVAMAIPVVGLVATAHWLTPLLLGPGWGATAALIPWVGAAIQVTIPIATIITTLLWAKDEPKKVLIMGIPSLIAVLGVGAAFMPAYGAVGAGIGLLAGGLVYVVSCVYYAHDVWGPSAVGQFIGPIVATALACAAGIAAGYAVGGGAFVGTVVSGSVGVLALIPLMLLLARRGVVDLYRFTGKARG